MDDVCEVESTKSAPLKVTGHPAAWVMVSGRPPTVNSADRSADTFGATAKVTVPLLAPEVADVTVSHEPSDTAVHGHPSVSVTWTVPCPPTGPNNPLLTASVNAASVVNVQMGPYGGFLG